MLITNEMVKEYADKPAVFAVKVERELRLRQNIWNTLCF